MGSNSQQDKDDDILELEVVETNPTGRYVRYEEILVEGSFRTVYKGFDEVNGLEIAWSKVELPKKIFESEKRLQSVCSQVNLLKSLKHENIIRCFHSWVDYESKTVNMITELFTSGTMSQYRKKHNLVDKKAIKNWARQILKGLDYLHCHNPRIIHGDLKCDNIFVNGNSGKVKIGDLGLAIMLQQQGYTRCAAGGTPEFMAPELFDEEYEYDQLVDVYSFGMCLLQMVTRELPYSECTKSCQIYKKVFSGIKPAAFSKVTDPQLKLFIEKCLGPVSERPSATELLNDPFLAPSSESGSPATSSVMSLRSESLGSSTVSTALDQKNYTLPAAVVDEVVKSTVSEKITFKIQGKMTKDKGSMSMILWIGKCGSSAKKIQFEFFPQTDTVRSVMEEMAKELELSAKDVTLITKLMEELVAELLPGYNTACSHIEERDSVLKSSSSEFQDVSQQSKSEELLFNGYAGAQQLQPAMQIAGGHNPARTSSLNEMKAKELNGGVDCHPKMFGSCDQTLSNNNQDRQDAEVIRRGNKRCSKHVAKARFRSLKKLLFFCGNKF